MAHPSKQNRTHTPLIKRLHWHNPKQKQTGLLPARPDGQTAALKPSPEVSFSRTRRQAHFDWRAANVINEIGVVAALWEPINSALISHPCRPAADKQKRGKRTSVDLKILLHVWPALVSHQHKHTRQWGEEWGRTSLLVIWRKPLIWTRQVIKRFDILPQRCRWATGEEGLDNTYAFAYF